jgi:gliding motility-associated-like protein
LNRKLFILAGCFFLIGNLARAQAPVAQFTSNITSGCAPLAVKFQDQSTNTPTSWEWSFGNGQTSSAQNPTISFGSPGTYTVTLIVKNAGGADAIRQTDYITVFASPIVSFSLNHLACAPANIQFVQNSLPGQGTIVSYAWTFGDGSSSNDPAPNHLYTQTGYYNVGLTITNSGGCTASNNYVRTLRVVPGVQPNFSWNETGNSCSAPFTLNFLNQTAGPGNLTYNWSLGAGATPATSTAINPSGIAYPSADTYSVTLIAQSDLGCADTLTQTVPLSSNTPVITAPAAGCINTPVNFSNGTTPAPISSTWNFGDGNTSNQSTTAHTYTASGPYTVTLTNTYANCTTTSSTTINIGATLVPTFTATPATACQAPLTVQFTDQTTPPATLWTWDFGDATGTSNLQNPSHTYTTTGNFDVKLTATTPGGCTGSTTQTQAIKITPPIINFAQQGACFGQPYSPAYSVTTIDPVATYSWSVPGATPSTATGANPSFTFPATGLYSLTLIVTTNGGCSATQTFTNAIQVGTPVTPTFTWNPLSPICGSTAVTFTSPTAGDQWYWTFGDGTSTDSGQTVTHQFTKFGGREVVLAVYNSGCASQASELVTINPPIPKFGYVVDCITNSATIHNNLIVSFLDSTIYDLTLPLTYTWNFGDGTSTPPASAPPYPPPPPTHTYPDTGKYVVTLTVSNGGCTAYAYRTVIIQNVIPSFTAPAAVCDQTPFNLTSTTQTFPFGTGRTGYIWNLSPTQQIHGSGNFSTHFDGIGNYPISLTVIDLNGCQYTSPTTTVAVVAPTVKFNSPIGGCINGAITFTDNSAPSALSPTISQWLWNFGDKSTGQYFNNTPVTHQYADTGSYNVYETILDGAGCVAMDSAVIQITNPHPSFIAPDSFWCPNTLVTFTDLSVGYSLIETWDFGDGTGTSNLPTHTFPAANNATYPVKLTLQDKYGCIKDTIENLKIETPIPAFTIADTTSVCTPLQTLFVASGQYYDSLYWEFGDGSTSTLANTSHFYNSIDTFTATLVLQGPGGCRDSLSKKVFLTSPATTTFNFTPKTACDSIVAQFTIVPPLYTTFTLQFGDQTADNSGNRTPIHTYRSPNSFVPYITLTDASGCIVTVTDTVLTVLGAVPFFTVNHNTFCDTGTIVFNDYTITNNGILTKTFDFGDGTTIPQPPPLTNPFDTTHYYSTPGNRLATLNVVTLANCTASYTDTIHIYQTPQPTISDSGYLCAGLIQFLGKLAITEVDTVFWQWDFGNGQSANTQNPLVNATAGGYNITLRAYVSYGCADTTSASITVNPNPTIKGPKEISTPVGVPVTIPFTYSPDVSAWTWTPAANLSCADCPNPAATLTFNQTYKVSVTDSNNCADTASILIKTVCNEENYFLPNTFSPNGDGVNDWFYPRGTSLYNIQSMTVFNRWGLVVFQRKNFAANSESMGWDGNTNGKPAPSDAYVYIVEVICNNAQVVALHGNVTLVR